MFAQDSWSVAFRVSNGVMRHALMLVKCAVDRKNNFLSFSLHCTVDISEVVGIIAILASWLCPRRNKQR